MSFNKTQIATIIEEVLERQGLYSDVAHDLLLGTMATESNFGTYLYQDGCRIARGIFQMEPATEKDIWENYLAYRPRYVKAITDISGVSSYKDNALELNLAYAICMARLHYRRVPEPFPVFGDIEGLGKYYKYHWNTENGKATIEKFMEDYELYVS